MKHRVVYTEEVEIEVIFEGPEDLKEEDFFEAMEADENAKTERYIVHERVVSTLEKEE